MEHQPTENIQVYLRMRPLNQRELTEENAIQAWRIVDQQSITLDQNIFNTQNHSSNRFVIPAGAYASLLAPCPGGPNQSKAYSFNQCFNPEESNQGVYERSSLRAIVMSSLEGINGTVFMYGQTGAGKTFTMLGNDGMMMRKFLENEQLSPKSAKLQMRRAASSARNHYNTITQSQTLDADLLQKKHQSRQSIEKRPDSITPRQQRPSIVPPLPPMIVKNKGGQSSSRNTITADTLTTNTLIDPPIILDDNDLPLCQDGILIMSLKELFQRVKDSGADNNQVIGQRVYIIRCSYFEIYNDSIFDLLNSQKEVAFNEPLQLQEDIRRKEFIVKGLKEYVVEGYNDCIRLLKLGEYNRHYAETRMNHQSSRSHTLFRLHVESVATTASGDDAGTNVIRESVLNFVDLAGSEKVSNHSFAIGGSNIDSNSLFVSPKGGSLTRKASIGDQNSTTGVNMRVKEGQHINKSLFFLTQVIALKAEMNNKKVSKDGVTQTASDAHIPYRNSPLTKILRSSLGGNSRTAIVLCITPSASQLEQTFSTLRFGQNAKMIKNTVVANVKGMGASENEIRQMLGEYERRLREMEWDKEESGRKMREMVEKLIRERDMLSERLIKANQDKLMIAGQVDAGCGPMLALQTSSDKPANEDQLEPEGPQFSLYLWGTGLLHSTLPIEKLVLQSSYQPNPQSRLYSTLSIQMSAAVSNPALDSSQQTILLQALRHQKVEKDDMQAHIEDLECQIHETMSQLTACQDQLILSADREDQLKMEVQNLIQDQEAMKIQIQQQQAAIQQLKANVEECESENKRVIMLLENEKNEKIAAQNSLEDMKMQFGEINKELIEANKQTQFFTKQSRQQNEINQQLLTRINEIEEAYQLLETNRFILNPDQTSQMVEDQIFQIEDQLYQGIQLLNYEKGKRSLEFKKILPTAPVFEQKTKKHEQKKSMRPSNSRYQSQFSSSSLNPDLDKRPYPQTSVTSPLSYDQNIEQNLILQQKGDPNKKPIPVQQQQSIDFKQQCLKTQKAPLIRNELVMLMSGEDMANSDEQDCFSQSELSINYDKQSAIPQKSQKIQQLLQHSNSQKSSSPFVQIQNIQQQEALTSQCQEENKQLYDLNIVEEQPLLYYSSPESPTQIVNNSQNEIERQLPRQNLIQSFNQNCDFQGVLKDIKNRDQCQNEHIIKNNIQASLQGKLRQQTEINAKSRDKKETAAFKADENKIPHGNRLQNNPQQLQNSDPINQPQNYTLNKYLSVLQQAENNQPNIIDGKNDIKKDDKVSQDQNRKLKRASKEVHHKQNQNKLNQNLMNAIANEPEAGNLINSDPLYKSSPNAVFGNKIINDKTPIVSATDTQNHQHLVKSLSQLLQNSNELATKNNLKKQDQIKCNPVIISTNPVSSMCLNQKSNNKFQSDLQKDSQNEQQEERRNEYLKFQQLKDHNTHNNNDQGYEFHSDIIKTQNPTHDNNMQQLTIKSDVNNIGAKMGRFQALEQNIIQAQDCRGQTQIGFQTNSNSADNCNNMSPYGPRFSKQNKEGYANRTNKIIQSQKEQEQYISSKLTIKTPQSNSRYTRIEDDQLISSEEGGGASAICEKWPTAQQVMGELNERIQVKTKNINLGNRSKYLSTRQDGNQNPQLSGSKSPNTTRPGHCEYLNQ